MAQKTVSILREAAELPGLGDRELLNAKKGNN
jgi:hypothetical protein